MGIFDIFGEKRLGDDPATDYAYQTGWAVLLIENLNAVRANKTASKKNKVQSTSVAFKAFIRTFKDSFNAGWQETQYPNQSVPIAHQSTPRRVIQIEWTVPSASKEEAVKNLAKCSWLAQSMYPTLKWSGYAGYEPKSSFMAIKFANLIQANTGGALPGYISNFNYTPNFVEGVHILQESEAAWANGYAQRKQQNLFPNVVDISLEFKPIQTRDSFGLSIGEDETGWNNSSWPYGIKIDPRLTPSSKPSTKSTTQLADPRATKIINSQKSEVTG
jgi:hypothetical protein